MAITAPAISMEANTALPLPCLHRLQQEFRHQAMYLTVTPVRLNMAVPLDAVPNVVAMPIAAAWSQKATAVPVPVAPTEPMIFVFFIVVFCC